MSNTEGYEHFHDPVRLITVSATITVLDSDVIIAVKQTSGAPITVDLFPSPLEGRLITIKDAKGDAGTNNITITTTDSSTIDGASSYVISSNYGHVKLIYNGTEWSII